MVGEWSIHDQLGFGYYSQKDYYTIKLNINNFILLNQSEIVAVGVTTAWVDPVYSQIEGMLIAKVINNMIFIPRFFEAYYDPGKALLLAGLYLSSTPFSALRFSSDAFPSWSSYLLFSPLSCLDFSFFLFIILLFSSLFPPLVLFLLSVLVIFCSPPPFSPSLCFKLSPPFFSRFFLHISFLLLIITHIPCVDMTVIVPTATTGGTSATSSGDNDDASYQTLLIEVLIPLLSGTALFAILTAIVVSLLIIFLRSRRRIAGRSYINIDYHDFTLQEKKENETL